MFENFKNKNYLICILAIVVFTLLSAMGYEGNYHTTGLLLEPSSGQNPPESLEDVLQLQDAKWISSEDREIVLDITGIENPSINWIKKSITNDSSVPKKFRLEFDFGPLYRVEFFSIDQSQKILPDKHTQQGRHGHLWSSSFSIASGKTANIYIKVSSIGVGLLKMSLIPEEEYANYDKIRSLILGTFFGSCLAFILLNSASEPRPRSPRA